MLLVLYYAGRERKKAFQKLFGLRESYNETHTLSVAARFARNLIFIFAVILLIIALSRPVWGKKIIPFKASGRDILFVVDVSKSMLATDISPSRLEHAKWLMRQIISQFPSERFGIVAFAGTAFLQCPLTIDKVSLLQMIDELKPDLIPLGGTNIQEAIGYSVRAFKGAEGAHRAIILISDGDELQGDVKEALEKIKEENIPIITIGLGNPLQSVPISIKDEKGNTVFLRDSQGNIASTKLNEELLSAIALATDGIYLRSTATDPGLDQVKPRIKALMTEEFSSGENTRPIDRFQIPLALAIILLLIRMAISERRKIIAAMFFISCFCICSYSNEAGPDFDLTKKISPQQIFNKALQLHSENKIEEAITLYQEAASHPAVDAETKKKSFQNLGAIQHESGRQALNASPQKALQIFSLAEKFYIEALREKTPNEDLKQNQQLLLSDIEKAKELLKQQQEMRNSKERAKQELEKASNQNQEAKESPDNNDKAEQAKQQTQNAKEAMNEYQEKIPDKDLQEKQQAKEISEEIERALEEQQKNNFNKAQSHLDNALQKMKEQEMAQQQKQEQKNEDNKENTDKKQQVEKAQSQPTEAKKEEKNIDPEQAEAILDLIAQDEKELKEKLLQEKLRKSQIKPVDKDW